MSTRCDNCGWLNSEDLANCSKCNTSLKNQRGEKATPIPAKPSNYSPPIGGTLKGSESNLPAWDAAPRAQPEMMSAAGANAPQKSTAGPVFPCPHCGYPNTGTLSKCVSCKKSLSMTKGEDIPPPPVNKPVVAVESPVIAPPQIIKSPTKPNIPSPFGGTIDPYRQAKFQKFYLRPLGRDGEAASSTKIEFEGNELSLNRHNLEPQNMTITGQTQAEIVNDNGKWFITDKSSKQTTFVHAKDGVELKKGDIILMGDRKFEFDC